ncbi:MAG: efflux RND transporter periplasmic adaptor subunit [Deltaproteobacteria bacterium]|nr:MAG: efflux RND transporter periplasmic adaptor subunit [Deltaproteobacteria bacterium]
MAENKEDKIPSSPFRVAVLTAVLTLLVAGGSAYFLGYLGPQKGEQAIEQGGGRKIAYWRAPMNPTEIYDKPGKSAMGMDLVPVYEDELVGGVEIKVDPVTQQNMGIRTAMVEKGPLVHTIRTYGHVTYDETQTAQVSPKISGWIEKIHVDFTGKYVEKGQPLFELYSPDLFAAQEEYLVTYRNLKRLSGRADKGLLASARQRLRYFDVADSEIRAMEKSGKINKTVTIRSPFSGIVTLKNAEAGSHIKAGTTVYRIADLSRVWVETHIYEYELAWVSEGQEAEMTLPYLPGRAFHGRVAYVYPYLQPKTRDVVIRIEFENPDMVLKPDMYADIRIKITGKEDGLIIPAEAVIRSGERNVVFVARENNKFTPRDVTLGRSLDDRKVQVLTGLAPGEVVVTSGQFLLDSESKLNEAVQKMLEAKRVEVKEAPDSEEDFFEDMEEER